jgi:hypothetical protein
MGVVMRLNILQGGGLPVTPVYLTADPVYVVSVSIEAIAVNSYVHSNGLSLASFESIRGESHHGGSTPTRTGSTIGVAQVSGVTGGIVGGARLVFRRYAEMEKERDSTGRQNAKLKSESVSLRFGDRSAESTASFERSPESQRKRRSCGLAPDRS